jgi:metallo-beta-lactamase class B
VYSVFDYLSVIGYYRERRVNMNKRIIVFGVLLGGALGILGSSLEVLVSKLADGVWLHTTYYDISGMRRVQANGLVVIDGKEAIMIDLPWTDEQTGVLFDWVAREHGATIRKVVPTHSHVDCAGGLAEVHRRGEDSYSFEKTVEMLRKANKPAPRNWFSRRMSLSCGNTPVELAFLGAGHTVDNIVVWIAAKKVLFGGCLVKSLNARHLGNVTEADLTGYRNTVKKVKQRYSQAQIVVPGHGSPGTMDLLEHAIALCRSQD